MARLFANRTIVVVIIVAAILLGSLIAFGLTREDPYRNKLNINRDEYRAALARWDNRHVTDYEATIQHTDWGRWHIVVHIDAAYGEKFNPDVRASYAHRVVDFKGLDSMAAEFAKKDPEVYEVMTVGALFDDLASDLYCQENSCERMDFFLPARYVVQFDQSMGYPRSIAQIDKNGTKETRIEDFKILK